MELREAIIVVCIDSCTSCDTLIIHAGIQSIINYVSNGIQLFIMHLIEDIRIYYTSN